MSEAVAGIFRRASDAASAVDDLIAENVNRDRISVLVVEETAKEQLELAETPDGSEEAGSGGNNRSSAADIFAGLTSAGALVTGSALLAAGPVVPDLTAGDDHNVPGGVLGRLRNLGFSEHKVDHFEEALSDGATLVAVSLNETDEEELLRGVLKRNDAQEVSST